MDSCRSLLVVSSSSVEDPQSGSCGLCSPEDPRSGTANVTHATGLKDKFCNKKKNNKDVEFRSWNQFRLFLCINTEMWKYLWVS